MKKFFYGFVALIAVFFIIVYTMLFTNFGNGIIANIAQDKIKQNTGLDLNITHFSLRFSSLDIKANLPNVANFSIEGDLSLLKLAFDLDYKIALDLKHAKNLALNSDQNSNFIGKIKGKASDFIIDGKGYLLGSEAFLDARVYDYNLIALNLDAKNIKIEELLHFLSYPVYAKGFLNAQAKISAQDLKPDGNIIIKLDTKYINYEAIKKDFSLDLPLDSNPKAEILADIKNDKIHVVSKIYNDYFILQAKKTLYDINKNTLDTDFTLHIPSLAKLERLTKTRLNGSMLISGEASLTNHALSALNAQLTGLGGEIKANLEDKKLFVVVNKARLEKLLALGGYGDLINGELNAKLINADLDFSNFDFEAKIDNVKLNTNEFKNIAKIKLLDTMLSLDAKANAKNNDIFYNAVLTSNVLNIKKFSGNYNLKNGELIADFNAFIDDLSQLNFINGQNIEGKADINAKVHVLDKKIQNLALNAKLADSVIKAISKGKKLDLNIDNLDLSKLFVIAGMPNYASGIINAKGNLDDLDLNHLSGNMDLEAKGVFNAAVLSKILSKKFPNNTNYDLNTRFNFNKNIIEFDTVLNSSLADLKSFKGTFDGSKMLLNSDFILNVKDFSKLGFLLDRKLKGKAEFDGKLLFDKSFDFTINSANLFEGRLQSTFKDNLLTLNANSIDLSNLAQSLDFIDIYQGKANLKANYNLLNEKGEVFLDMKDGRLKPNLITNTLKILISRDITNDVYSTVKAKALINKENIQLDLNMKADRSYVLIQSGALDSKSGALNLPFDIKFDKANFKGSIKGTTEHPKISLNAQSVLNSIKNVIGVRPNNDSKDPDKKTDKAINELLNDFLR
ncbi:hypothetical protein LNU06_03250 [Campylobacter sp. VicNov18]|uniref:hypothetical protein n=1 Tax=Campylobacter bilis TaxID=2691918 RepID=UPI00130E8F92|nr:hypothetical protein [Campylobacter bilis]MPV63158.1 hypothetical protein [Campylobacter hepaticus]MBM0636658.1 hypothetical protein [Campylobacter bilis]MCC8277502.1 hypothetical protein [Campylobacter bilis]MCC8298707.1 hypothetical protein [Campylobacter bilis]MCC8300411.1 hypothetical protein [Campylobacter bilis]